MSLEQLQAAGGAMLNQAAAAGQTTELQVSEGKGPARPEMAVNDGPSVSFSISAPLDDRLASRSPVARGRPDRAPGGLLREGHARVDAAGLSPGEAHQPERDGPPARRSDRVRRAATSSAGCGSPWWPPASPSSPGSASIRRSRSAAAWSRNRARCRGAIRSSTTSSGSACGTIATGRSSSSCGTACPGRRASRSP